MISVPADDDALDCLPGTTIPSPTMTDVSYVVSRRIGAGGMSVAFLALRSSPDGAAPVVVKVMRPFVMRQSARTGTLIALKETVALGRLNESVPPTPFVVRLIETGELHAMYRGGTLELPWLAIEYVHGGTEGTTLHERVRYSTQRTGYAFDPNRARHAVECLAIGIDAIHGVGVIHRDLTPANVLCCGFGNDEIFKIADFGIARPAGADTFTFGGVPVGTPGYASPEQLKMAEGDLGSASDVFSLAAITFRMLTGEDYFDGGESPIDILLAVKESERRSIREAEALTPELREKPAACDTIDRVLARATALDPQHRPQSGAMFAATLAPALRADQLRLRTTERRLRSIAESVQPTLVGGWSWLVRQHPGGQRVVRSVAWDGDGHCLVADTTGLAFWNGTSWEQAPTGDLPVADGIHFVRRVGAGRWLVGGDQATIAEYTPDGVTEILKGPDANVSFTFASGDMKDLGVLVGERPNEPPLLYAVAGGHWLKPAALTKAESVTALARIGEDQWLVAGRSVAGDGFVALYQPLMWEVKRLTVPSVRAYLGCAGLIESGLACVVGASGRTARIRDGEAAVTVVEGEPDLSSTALDAAGRAWATSAGRVWLQQPGRDEWHCIWKDESWKVPFVSVQADVNLVRAMTVDGAIVEGRSEDV